MKLRDHYQEAVKLFQPKPSYFFNSLKAFFVGGFICAVGQALQNLYIEIFTLHISVAQQMVLGTFILLATLLTGMGVYDKIGQFAGAGSLIPITGFANSLASAAIEHRSEGIVLGVASNMFKVAGAVIVYSVVIAYILGVIHYLFSTLF
ncbi:stage V sporulation protein AC [Anoxybacillus vitaminiphilus]|uniref:Stage V sporulation protein AC n=1 Tax=Paranoxybacillus vitaminiphilus TaxID=581036 RepID=A0A327YRB4_9BACL|nr:stage V sporulation protein AC [Anoxybacillus vitaminiphilus]RAK22245.1 stage V sporulation protein AC [Anoxybacillus vitaminiphilus]